MHYCINNVNDKTDNSNDHGQPYCFKETQLVVLSTQSAKAFKGNLFFYFQSEDFKAFQLFKFQWLQSQIFGPRNDSNLVPW